MKKALLVLCALVLAGCANMSPAERTVWTVVGTAVVVGAIAANDSSDSPQRDSCYFVIRGDGSSDQVCR